MKHLFGIVFVLFGLHASAQNLWLMGKDSSWRSSYGAVLLEAKGDYRSNVFNNQMTDKLAFGGQLDPMNVGDLEENLKDMNRFGVDLQVSAQFFGFADSLFGNQKWAWTLQLTHRDLTYVNFTDDAFRLAFQGNKQFRGAHADLSGSRFNSITYQKLGFGVFHKETLSGLRLSLVNGQEFTSITIDDADLFTSFLGDSLSLTYAGNFLQSDTTFRGLGKGNGVGAALDADWNLPLEGGKGFLSIALRDFGFVSWGERTHHNTADSVFNYTGFDVQDFFDEGVSNIQFPVLEDTLGYTSEQKTHFQWLPASVDVSLRRRNTDRDFFEIGMNVRPQIAYIPQIYGGYHYFTNPKTLVSATFRYGGYGQLRFGASIEKWVGNNWYLAVLTDDVPGFLLNNMKGRGLYVRFSRLLQHHDRKSP